ncbi:hypothetical protein Tco_1347090 [Tanacetum coccineum]
MSADSAVTYTSVHSEARSWSIPSEDPYEEAAKQWVSVAGTTELTRQPDPTIETRLLDTKRRMMTALELVNRRISTVRCFALGECSEFCTRHTMPKRFVQLESEDLKILRTRENCLRAGEYQEPSGADDLAVRAYHALPGLEACERALET